MKLRWTALPPSLTGLFWLLLAAALMAIDLKHPLEPLREGIARLLFPVERGVSRSVAAFRALGSWLHRQETLLREKRRLEAQLAELKVRTMAYEALLEENRRLRALLKSSAQRSFRPLATEVLWTGPVWKSHRIVVDRGRSDGVREGMAVFAAEGLVGQVVRAFERTSEVVLLSDPNHAVPVYLQRNGLHALLVGGGRPDRLLLQFLPETADVEEGDLLLTSGLGDHFPRGYPVARVVRVRRLPSSPFLEVVARPLAPLDRLHFLFIALRDGESH